MTVSFIGVHFPKEVILMGVRWYVAHPLSTRHVEELMEERGVSVDHAIHLLHGSQSVSSGPKYCQKPVKMAP
jgi:putative transposase